MWIPKIKPIGCENPAEYSFLEVCEKIAVLEQEHQQHRTSLV